jgi:hypothetical protein
MRELLYTILGLEEWNKGTTCDFCSNLYGKNNEAVCQIRTRSKLTDRIVGNACACESCKEKFENDELPKCKRCGRLQTKHDIEILSGKYICDCVRNNEDLGEKELPILPHERRPNAFYESQINSLREELNEAEWTISMEREEIVKFQEKSEEWGKRQKQELLDRIKELEAEVERLKKQTELVGEIEELKAQLEKFMSQQTAQIEIKEPKKWPWRLKK